MMIIWPKFPIYRNGHSHSSLWITCRLFSRTRDRGGYILCGSQELMDDIPLDNILAMYDENLG